jgi:hypothetical protein
VKYLVLATAAITSTGVAYAAPFDSRGTIEITQDNVDLTGAGKVKFPIVWSKLNIDWSKLNIVQGLAKTIKIKIWFDGSGRAVQCDPVDPVDDISNPLCSQAIPLARFNFIPGFSLPLRRGFVIMRLLILTERTYQLELDHPVAFAPAGAGAPILVLLSSATDAAGGRRCSASAGRLSDSAKGEISESAKGEICAAFLAEEANGQRPCAPSGNSSGTTPTAFFECRVAAREGAFSSRTYAQADEVPGYSHVVIRYPWDDTLPEVRLSKGDGQLRASFGSGDYPALPLRFGLAGTVEMLLGVRSDGTIGACRPMISSGAAALDNASCEVITRRARYQFYGDRPIYSGLKYIVYSIIWRMP